MSVQRSDNSNVSSSLADKSEASRSGPPCRFGDHQVELATTDINLVEPPASSSAQPLKTDDRGSLANHEVEKKESEEWFRQSRWTFGGGSALLVGGGVTLGVGLTIATGGTIWIGVGAGCLVLGALSWARSAYSARRGFQAKKAEASGLPRNASIAQRFAWRIIKDDGEIDTNAAKRCLKHLQNDKMGLDKEQADHVADVLKAMAVPPLPDHNISDSFAERDTGCGTTHEGNLGNYINRIESKSGDKHDHFCGLPGGLELMNAVHRTIDPAYSDRLESTPAQLTTSQLRRAVLITLLDWRPQVWKPVDCENSRPETLLLEGARHILQLLDKRELSYSKYIEGPRHTEYRMETFVAWRARTKCLVDDSWTITMVLPDDPGTLLDVWKETECRGKREYADKRELFVLTQAESKAVSQESDNRAH